MSRITIHSVVKCIPYIIFSEMGVIFMPESKVNAISEQDLMNVSGGGNPSPNADGSKCTASKGANGGGFQSYCSSPNHKTIGDGSAMLANGGGCYRYRICMNCGAKWTEWLSNSTNKWEVWKFGEHST